jgi:hypothetical protein
VAVGNFAAGLVLVMAIAPAAAAQSDRYGVHTYYLSPYLAEKSRELGTGYVRIEIDWDALQANGPDEWTDAQLLDWLDTARANRLKLYATLMNTPRWAGPCQHCMPDQNGPWQNFVYRVIAEIRTRYPDLEVVYGIWNEPNLTGPRGFFSGTDADYATLFGLADMARRAANPAARLAGPELSPGGLDPYGYLDSVMTRLQPYLRSSDVITVHWYPGQGSLSDWMNAAAARSQGREVWLTETGASTCNDTEQRGWIDFIVNTFDYGSPSARWTKVFVYYLWDAYTNCDANLVRTDGSNRPAFMDYRNRAIGQFSPIAAVALRTANNSALAGFERLDLIDLNGGALNDGDPIALQTPRGLYLQADQGGGAGLLDMGFTPAVWETFTLVDIDRPAEGVRDGDRVALRSSSGFYVSAEMGGGAEVNVNRQSVGSWETFQLLRTPHMSSPASPR